jgi:hypothetical protein
VFIDIAQVARVEPAVTDEGTTVVPLLAISEHDGRPLQCEQSNLAGRALDRVFTSAVELEDSGIDVWAPQPN